MAKQKRAGVHSSAESWYFAFARKGWAYWLLAGVFSSLAIYCGYYVDTHHMFLQPRYWIFARLEGLQRRPRPASRTLSVKITDSEFYDDRKEALPFAGRRPLRREVLAKLVGAIALADPAVIAIDVDFRSPHPSAPPEEFDLYRHEDEVLWKTICEIVTKGNTSVVLTKALWSDNDGVIADSSIYDGQTTCVFPTTRVSYGYAAVPFDTRKIPPPLKLANGDTVDSFPVAIVRAYLHEEQTVGSAGRSGRDSSPARGYLSNLRLDSADGGELPFGSFVNPNPIAPLSASDALHCVQHGGCATLAHSIVIISGDWHELAANRGEFADTHLTPAGIISGGDLVVNWVEAILSGEVRYPLPEWLRLVPDAIFVLLLYYAVLVDRSLAWRISFLVLTLSVLAVGAWLLFQTAAVFFDVFPITLSIAIHLLFERLYGMEHRQTIRAPRQAKRGY